MSARPLKLLSSSVEHLADQLRRQVVLAQQYPEQTRERDVDRHEHARQKRHIPCQQAKAAVDVATESLRKPVDDGQVVHSVLRRSSAVSGNARRRGQKLGIALDGSGCFASGGHVEDMLPAWPTP